MNTFCLLFRFTLPLRLWAINACKISMALLMILVNNHSLLPSCRLSRSFDIFVLILPYMCWLYEMRLSSYFHNYNIQITFNGTISLTRASHEPLCVTIDSNQALLLIKAFIKLGRLSMAWNFSCFAGERAVWLNCVFSGCFTTWQVYFRNKYTNLMKHFIYFGIKE